MRREANSDRIQNRRRAQSLRSELREDPEAYFERVQERKARAAEDEYRHRHKAKQVRSYREEKRDYERSKQVHRYLPEEEYYEEDLAERRARMQRQLRQQQ